MTVVSTTNVEEERDKKKAIALEMELLLGSFDDLFNEGFEDEIDTNISNERQNKDWDTLSILTPSVNDNLAEVSSSLDRNSVGCTDIQQNNRSSHSRSRQLISVLIEDNFRLSGTSNISKSPIAADINKDQQDTISVHSDSSTHGSNNNQSVQITGRSLRKRRDIQLHPFTIERTHFNNLIKKSSPSTRRRQQTATLDLDMFNVSSQINDADPDDDEFIPGIDNIEPNDDIIPDTQEILDLQDTSHRVQPMKRKPTTNKPSTVNKASTSNGISVAKNATTVIDLPPVSTANKTSSNLTAPSDTLLPISISSSTHTSAKRKAESDEPILYIPPRINSNKQTIIHTYASKKKTKSRTIKPTTSLTQTSSLVKDVFEFDPRPPSRIWTNLPNQLEHMHIDTSPTPQSNTITAPNDKNNEEDKDIEDDEIQLNILRRPKKRRIIELSDSEDDESIPSEQMSIFDFPTDSPGPPAIYRISDMTPNDNDDDIVPIVEDKAEHSVKKRQRIGLKDLFKEKKVLKGVLPMSFARIYKTELTEEASTMTQHQSSKGKSTSKPRSIQPTSSIPKYTTIPLPEQNPLSIHKNTNTSPSAKYLDIFDIYSQEEEAIETNRIPTPHRATNEMTLPKDTTSKRKPRRKNVPRYALDDIYVRSSKQSHTPQKPLRVHDDINIGTNQLRMTRSSEWLHQMQNRNPRMKWVPNVNDRVRATLRSNRPDTTRVEISEEPYKNYSTIEDIIDQALMIDYQSIQIFHSHDLYLNHGLLPSITSKTEDSKNALMKLRSTHSQLQLFGLPYEWADFARSTDTLSDVFYKALHLISNIYDGMTPFTSQINSQLEYFYLFVTLYISQWMQCHTEDEESVSPIIDEIRTAQNFLSGMISLDDHKHREMILKALLFILDWKCRLYDKINNQSIIEWFGDTVRYLISMGPDSVYLHYQSNDIMETWLCLFQLVSSKLYELQKDVFLTQIVDSISKCNPGVDHEKLKDKWKIALASMIERYLL
ncbi:hypothetical protein BDB01DRAFT_789276 [Pilobolus umbonatus]|nr:hypothetical protein BDB01DRAFT_789276 [Pilobolus umbonatus]